MKKVLLSLLIISLLTGCYARHGGIPLYNSYGYHYTPDNVVVQKGDTLYSLSKKYNVPLRSIVEENNLSSPYTLNVGQKLVLPVRQTYTVAKGDTLYSISKKYNINMSSLIKSNGLEEPYSLNVGQTLAIPQSSSSGRSYYVQNKTQSNSANNKVSTSPKSIFSSNKNQKQIAQTSTPRQKVSAYRKNKFIWPVNGSVVSNFGVVGKGRRNDGINIKAATGTNVKAADKGIVAYAGNELKGFGNLVLIKHSDGYITAYAHNDKLYVKKGQSVLRGEKIATVGSTGSVNTPQLHFEVRAGKKAVNPRAYLP